MHCTKCLGRKCGGWWLPLAVHTGAQTASAGRWLETEPPPSSQCPWCGSWEKFVFRWGYLEALSRSHPRQCHTHTPLPSLEELTAFFSLSAFYIFTYNRLCWTLLFELPVCRTTLIVIVNVLRCNNSSCFIFITLHENGLENVWMAETRWFFFPLWMLLPDYPSDGDVLFLLTQLPDDQEKKRDFSVSVATLQRSSQWLMGRLSMPYWSETKRPLYWSSLQSCRCYLHFC